jgi:hypothetical protein
MEKIYMQLKKVKLVSAIVLTAPFFVYSAASTAAKAESSNFMIKLFNNTTINQPLHYSVTSQGHDSVEGMLPVGDNNGKSITIKGNKSSDKASAEVILTDTAGHVVWNGTVSFYGKTSEFYSITISLDSHYNVGTNSFPTIHTISYDIRD